MFIMQKMPPYHSYIYIYIYIYITYTIHIPLSPPPPLTHYPSPIEMRDATWEYAPAKVYAYAYTDYGARGGTRALASARQVACAKANASRPGSAAARIDSK